MADDTLQANFDVLPNGDVKETTRILGELTERFYRLSAQARDEAIQAALVQLGWAPPGTVESLRREVEALKADVNRRRELWADQHALLQAAWKRASAAESELAALRRPNPEVKP